MALLTSFWILDLLILALTTAIALYFYATKNYNYWKQRGVSSLPTTLFFGNTARCVFARQTVDTFLRSLYNEKKDEKLVGFYVFNQPYLMVRDLDLIKNIFVKDFWNFSNKMLGVDKKDTLGNTNLFIINNPPWKHIRSKLTQNFTSGKLRKMVDLMLEIRDDFDHHMDSYNITKKESKIVDVSEITGMLMTDIIGTTAFGMKFNSLTNPEAEFRKVGRQIFTGGYKRYLDLLSIFFMPALRFLLNPHYFGDSGDEFLRNSFWHVLNHRTKTGEKRNDFMDILLDIKKKQEVEPDSEYKLEGDSLVAQAAIFFTGGFETTSTALSFTLFELARNTEIQNKLRNEILEAIDSNDGKITYDMIMTLPYLNMVVLEGLRMYPVIPWLDRVSETDYRFPGTEVKIGKGIPCILPMRGIHLDPKYFPNPEQFDPERFSERNKKDIKPFTFFPFGEGPRNCIGNRLGVIQTKLGMIFFLSRYEISLSPETNIPVKLDLFNVLTHSDNGMPLNLRRI